MNVKVDIEFCGTCGYHEKFNQLAERIQTTIPTADVSGKEGRRGSFEVQVNGQLIHSKLSTMAFPDFTNVIDIVGDAAQGKEVKSVSVQQPITDCDIM